MSHSGGVRLAKIRRPRGFQTRYLFQWFSLTLVMPAKELNGFIRYRRIYHRCQNQVQPQHSEASLLNIKWWNLKPVWCPLEALPRQLHKIHFISLFGWLMPWIFLFSIWSGGRALVSPPGMDTRVYVVEWCEEVSIQFLLTASCYAYTTKPEIRRLDWSRLSIKRWFGKVSIWCL